MANRPMRLEINCETGEQKEIPLTDEEIAAMEENAKRAQEQDAARLAELEAKEAAKASAIAKLAELGLTKEEAAAIAGA